MQARFDRGNFLRVGTAGLGGLLLARCAGGGPAMPGLPQQGSSSSENKSPLNFAAQTDATGVTFVDASGRTLFRVEATSDVSDFVVVSKHPALNNNGFRLSSNAVKLKQEQVLGLGYSLSPLQDGSSFTGPSGKWGTVIQMDKQTYSCVCPTIGWNGVRMSAPVKPSPASGAHTMMAPMQNCVAWDDEWDWAFTEMIIADAALVACPIDPIAIAAVAVATAHMGVVRNERPSGCR